MVLRCPLLPLRGHKVILSSLELSLMVSRDPELSLRVLSQPELPEIAMRGPEGGLEWSRWSLTVLRGPEHS